MLIRLMNLPNQERRRNSATHCDKCGLATREGKNLCTDHIEERPYVKALLAMIEDKEQETDAVAKKGKKAVKPNSLTARELLMELFIKGC